MIDPQQIKQDRRQKRREERKLNGISGAIVRGEIGPKARPIREEWITEIRDICVRDEAEFFFKQWGGVNPKSGGRSLRIKSGMVFHGRLFPSD